MEKSVKITLILSAVILIIVFGSLFIVKDFVSQGNVISSEGEARLKVTPDITKVYFSVETKDVSADKAKNMNNEIFNRILTSLTVNGINKDDVKTEQFSVNENIEWDGTKSVNNGFIAQHSASISLKDFEKIGVVIDAVVNNGGKINYVNFELSQEKQNEFKTQALKMASEDATRKAEAIASGLNKKLGSLVSVQTSDFGYRPWPVFAQSGVADKIAIEKAVINPSDQDVTATVTVQYRIK